MLIPESIVNVLSANTFLMNINLSKPEHNQQRSDRIPINCTRVTLKVTILTWGKWP